MYNKVMRILLGAPGVGKGSVARYFSTEYIHLSPGELIRKTLEKDSSLLKKINQGNMLVEEVNMIVQKFILDNDVSRILLDGYPRVLDQANFLSQSGLKIQKTFLLHAPKSLLEERILHRTICQACQTSFIGQNICCGHQTLHREDDNLNVYQRRFDTYMDNIQGILNILKGPIYFIDASKPLSDVIQEVRNYW